MKYALEVCNVNY